MPWTETNNDHLYARFDRCMARLNSACDEAQKLMDLAEAFGADVTDLASGDHTKAELVQIRDKIILLLLAFRGQSGETPEAVPAEAVARITYMQEWVVDDD